MNCGSGITTCITNICPADSRLFFASNIRPHCLHRCALILPRSPIFLLPLWFLITRNALNFAFPLFVLFIFTLVNQTSQINYKYTFRTIFNHSFDCTFFSLFSLVLLWHKQKIKQQFQFIDKFNDVHTLPIAIHYSNCEIYSNRIVRPPQRNF